MRKVILLAGPSGSGKSRLAAAARCPRLNLDDFYLDGDHPGLPHTLGIVDWDDPASWDGGTAVATIATLCAQGRAEVPVYDISTSRRTGAKVLDLGDAALFVAEGLFAPDVVAACRATGVEMDAVYLDRARTQNLVFRFLRDVSEHRKPLVVLVRRGLALWRAEPGIRRHALASGCRPVSFREAVAIVTTREPS
ncbi:MAG TPA: uridine kinase [Propionibacteriaceae bacterium]